MKTFGKNILVFLLLSLVSACVKDDMLEKELSVAIEARMEVEEETKTTLSDQIDGMYYSLWSAGDEISVYVDGDEHPSKFTLKSGEGSTISLFEGSRKGNEYVAVYPYSISDKNHDGTISLTLPVKQTYVKDSFGPGAFPMIAKGNIAGGLKFMNLASVLKVSMTGRAAIKSITLTANDKDTYLSGPAEVSSDYASAPHLTMMSGGSQSVVLDGIGVELSEEVSSDFYIVIPAQTYKGGFKLEIDAYNEVVVKEITSDLTFERSEMRSLKGVVLDVEVPDVIVDALPDNEIWYISEGEVIVELKTDIIPGFISNTYKDGKGVIRFKNDVTSLPAELFINPKQLKEIFLPSKIAAITGNPLYMTHNLEAIHGKLASEDNRSLILDGVLYSVAAYGLEEYATPSGVTDVARNVFFRDPNLKKVVFSEGVVGLGDDLLNDSNVQEIHLPSTLSDIGSYSFSMCPNVKGFYGNSTMITEDNLAVVVDNYNNLGKRTLISYASGSDNTSYTIPEDVELIESYTFYHAENLNEVTFPSPVEFASGSVFEKSDNIEKIYGPNVYKDGKSLIHDGLLTYVAPKGLVNYTTPPGVTKLAYGVFDAKLELETVVLSDEVEAVGSAITCRPYSIPLGYILWDCPNLKSVTVSANMRILGMDPFGGDIYSKAKNLGTVYMRALIPPVIGHNQPDLIPGLFENLTIYVPQTSLQAYKASPDWAPYRNYLKGYDYTDLPVNDVYVSVDYSMDGDVVTLQQASKGNGIDIVLMGDAYSDRQVTNGYYKQDMELLYDNLFAEEPYKSFKDYFNVYYVNVVSATEGYEFGNTALDTWFGDGTEVGGSDQSVFEYALNAITEERMDEAMLVVAMNSDAYAGTCYMYYPTYFTDYGSGVTVSYFPRGNNVETFVQLLHHEANGHGFAKLADEYAYKEYGHIGDEEKAKSIEDQNERGWWKNVDFTSDPANVRWNHFLKDDRYAAEGLGAYEGGLTYWTGVWRPTENSIMRYNVGGFNAPSREAIYYRINKLAYGKDWEYDYEDFVEYDAINRSASAESVSVARSRRSNYVEIPVQPAAPPVVVGKSWRDAQ